MSKGRQDGTGPSLSSGDNRRPRPCCTQPPPLHRATRCSPPEVGRVVAALGGAPAGGVQHRSGTHGGPREVGQGDWGVGGGPVQEEQAHIVDQDIGVVQRVTHHLRHSDDLVASRRVALQGAHAEGHPHGVGRRAIPVEQAVRCSRRGAGAGLGAAGSCSTAAGHAVCTLSEVACSCAAAVACSQLAGPAAAIEAWPALTSRALWCCIRTCCQHHSWANQGSTAPPQVVAGVEQHRLHLTGSRCRANNVSVVQPCIRIPAPP